MVNHAAALILPAERQRADELLDRAIDIDAISASLEPYLSHRRVKYWPDVDVRGALIVLHGETTLNVALDAITRRFGSDRTPSKSGCDRLWQRLWAAKKAGWRLYGRAF